MKGKKLEESRHSGRSDFEKKPYHSTEIGT
jgi:hypothetical protein